jgi:zinc protease
MPISKLPSRHVPVPAGSQPGRPQQIFQIWIRPVEPANGHFVLRAALYEFDRLIRDGLSREEFEITRQ